MKMSTTVRVCNRIAYLALHQNRQRKAGCWFLWRFAAFFSEDVKGTKLQPLKSSYESFSNSQVAFEEPPVFRSDMGMVHRSLTQNSVKQWGFAMIGPSESYFNIESWCCIWSEAPPIWIMGLLKIAAAWLQKFLDKSSRMLCTFESPVRFDVLILHHKLAGSWRCKLWWERPSYTKPAENVQPLACYSTGRNQLEGSQAGCPADIETLLWFCMIQNKPRDLWFPVNISSAKTVNLQTAVIPHGSIAIGGLNAFVIRCDKSIEHLSKMLLTSFDPHMCWNQIESDW